MFKTVRGCIFFTFDCWQYGLSQNFHRIEPLESVFLLTDMANGAIVIRITIKSVTIPCFVKLFVQKKSYLLEILLQFLFLEAMTCTFNHMKPGILVNADRLF